MIKFIKSIFRAPTIETLLAENVLSRDKTFPVIDQPTKEELLADFRALQHEHAARRAFEETVPDPYPYRIRSADGRYVIACVEAAWQDFYENYDGEVGA